MTNRQFQREFKKADKAGEKYYASVTTTDGTGVAGSYTRGYTEKVYNDGQRAGAIKGIVGIVVGAMITMNADRIGNAIKNGWTAMKTSLKGEDTTVKDTKDTVEYKFEEDEVVLDGTTF